MEGTGLIMTLVIGGIAGWLAGNILKGGGFGLLINIILGIVGAFIGNFAFGMLGIAAGGWIGQLVAATIGALILLFVVGLFKKSA
jgi:uncharacterized membrane protein YeaQ/YmgE (transglycosylase-associated protein family)